MTRSLDGGEARWWRAAAVTRRAGSPAARPTAASGAWSVGQRLPAHGQSLAFPTYAAGGYDAFRRAAAARPATTIFAQLRNADLYATLEYAASATASCPPATTRSTTRPIGNDDFTLAGFTADRSRRRPHHPAPARLLRQLSLPRQLSVCRAQLPQPGRCRGAGWGFEERLVSRAIAGQRWTFSFEYRDSLRQNQKNADLRAAAATAASRCCPAPASTAA